MQMKKIKYFIYGLGLLLASAFTACSDSEEDIPVPPVEKETCSLTIQLGAEGTAETRVSVDEKAKPGEFINTLWVFVTNRDGLIEAKFNLRDGSSTYISEATDTNTPNGNVSQWMHTVEGVPTGEKIIYAFANMDNVSTTETTPRKMSDILNGYYNNGGTINVDDLIISNPAATIDIANGNYIPMSLKEEVTITGDQTIYVELVRLVGRVDITINNSKEEAVTVQSCTMKDFADQVSLINGEPVTPTYDRSITVSDLNATIDPNSSSANPLFSFYVNETLNDKTYDITLTTNENGETSYSGALTLSDETVTGIPRNYYLPLTLNIGENKFIIEIYVAPIGGYPRNVITYNDLLNPSATKDVKVPEGCSLRVKDANTDQYCTLSTTANGIVAITDNTWAHITALQTTGDISVIAEGTTIPLTIIPLADYALTGSLGWEMIPQGVLMMK